MANLIGVLLGAGIDRSEGGDGIAGAVEGYFIEGAIKVVAPLVVTFALGWSVQFLARRAFEAATGSEAGGPAANG